MTANVDVALRKESVDRNTQRRDFKRLGLLSLSARRAWIEISWARRHTGPQAVALRKESVDRNTGLANILVIALKSLSARRAWIEMTRADVGGAGQCWSLSARRAWIEISPQKGGGLKTAVALRKESVDRNLSGVPVNAA